MVARVEAPNSLRALYGTEGVRNATHGSDARKYYILKIINSWICLKRIRLFLWR